MKHDKLPSQATAHRPRFLLDHGLQVAGCTCGWKPQPAGNAEDQRVHQPAGDAEDQLVHHHAESLMDELYSASALSLTVGDRSRIGAALDSLLAYVDCWQVDAPEYIAALFKRLDATRLVRAVGQTLLATTRCMSGQFTERQTFLAAFLREERQRGASETLLERLRLGLGPT